MASLPPPEEQPDNVAAPQFPNRLREVREAQLLSRATLIELCRRLAQEDSARYAPPSMTTLHGLENGSRRPRMRTAATLSTVLNVPVETLFSSGLDSPARNPSGNTSDSSTWSRRGRPPKSNPSTDDA